MPDTESLELGSVKVWLGMQKQKVLSLLKESGYEIPNPDSSPIVVFGPHAKDQPPKDLFTLAFSSNRLIYADREWYTGDRDIADAVISALRTLEGRNCRIVNAPVDNPQSETIRVFVLCGSRSVLIGKLKMHVDRGIGTGPYVDVLERIGELPPQ